MCSREIRSVLVRPAGVLLYPSITHNELKNNISGLAKTG